MIKKPVGLKDFKIEMVPVGDLLPYVNNPKAHPAGQVDKIASSIKNFGFLVRLVTPPGGVVLDHFMGSGSTLIAAAIEGFDAVGIDLEGKNCEITERRFRGNLGMLAEVKHG